MPFSPYLPRAYNDKPTGLLHKMKNKQGTKLYIKYVFNYAKKTQKNLKGIM